jgi:corrinoid protein of di/trimethylamine methyltransferase
MGNADEASLILRRLAAAVVDMDGDAAAEAAREALRCGVDPYVAISEGLSVGMQEVNELYERGEYFVPEILCCSDAMNVGIDILKPHLQSASRETPMRLIIGVIEGDIHDLGKNIVKIMLDAAGFDVVDLGKGVRAEAFVEEAQRAGTGIVGLSTLMSTTMGNMEKVTRGLVEAGLRDRFAVMIGGGPTSPAFAEKIGADGHGATAKDAVALAQELARRLTCAKTA